MKLYGLKCIWKLIRFPFQWHIMEEFIVIFLSWNQKCICISTQSVEILAVKITTLYFVHRQIGWPNFTVHIYPWAETLISLCTFVSADMCQALQCIKLLYFVSPWERPWRQRIFQTRARHVCLLARSKMNTGIDAYRMRLAACILRRTQWRHGRFWDEINYRCILAEMQGIIFAHG